MPSQGAPHIISPGISGIIYGHEEKNPVKPLGVHSNQNEKGEKEGKVPKGNHLFAQEFKESILIWKEWNPADHAEQ